MKQGYLIVIVACFQVGTLSVQAGVLGVKINNSSVQSKAQVDPTSIKTSAKTSSLGAAYSVREIDNGIRIVKEFVDSEGVVFAISWEGLGRPDFSEIFGDYYDDFVNESKAQFKSRNRKSMNVQASRIVVTNSGHGSDMRGLAYLPAFLPSGVAPEDLK